MDHEEYVRRARIARQRPSGQTSREAYAQMARMSGRADDFLDDAPDIREWAKRARLVYPGRNLPVPVRFRGEATRLALPTLDVDHIKWLAEWSDK